MTSTGVQHGMVFQQSKALAFLESVAIERNLYSNRSIPTVGVGPGVVKLAARERVDHSFTATPDPAHIHTRVVDDTDSSLVVGAAGAFGSIPIPGSGWVRAFLRVKGVAAQIPEMNLDWTAGSAQDVRCGSIMVVNGCHYETILRCNVTSLPDVTNPALGNPFVNHPMNNGAILNLVRSGSGFADGAIEFDRIMSVSVQAPRTLTLSVPWQGWCQATWSGTWGGFYTGGISDPLFFYSGSPNVGSPVRAPDNGLPFICRNDGVNSRSLLPPFGPLFANPTNIVQLQVQLLGWRPDSAPRPETYSD